MSTGPLPLLDISRLTMMWLPGHILSCSCSHKQWQRRNPQVEVSLLPPGDVNTGEAKVAALAISLAASPGNSPLILEGDSQMVAMAINHPDSLQNGTSSQQLAQFKSWSASLRPPERQIPKLVIAKWAASHQTFGSIPTNMYPISCFSGKKIKISRATNNRPCFKQSKRKPPTIHQRRSKVEQSHTTVQSLVVSLQP